MRLHTIVTVAIVLLSSPGTVEAQSLTPSTAARIDAIFAHFDAPGSPGAAVGIVDRGELVFSAGYGMANLEYDIPITPRTIFHVASVSKQFAAFAVVLLAQEGRLSLDDDIRMYVPEVPDFGETITIRHLLHHTSGLRDQWSLLAMAGWRLDDVITRDQIFRLIQRQRELNFSPGTEHLYSNTGYTLLAEIVERVAEQPFGEWMGQRVFEPLGMHSTLFYEDHERIVRNRAYSYQSNDNQDGFRKSNLNYATVGATSLFTTVEDLARWIINMRSGDVGGMSALEAMLERGVLATGDTLEYASGLIVDDYRGLRRIHHGGADAGYRTFFSYFPGVDVGILVLSNLATSNPGTLAMQVADLYLHHSLAKPVTASSSVPTGRAIENVMASETPLRDLEGRYFSPELETTYDLTVLDDGRMVARHPRHPDIVLVPRSEDRMSGSTWFLSDVVVERDEHGRVARLRISNGRVRNLVFEKVR